MLNEQLKQLDGQNLAEIQRTGLVIINDNIEFLETYSSDTRVMVIGGEGNVWFRGLISGLKVKLEEDKELLKAAESIDEIKDILPIYELRSQDGPSDEKPGTIVVIEEAE